MGSLESSLYPHETFSRPTPPPLHVINVRNLMTPFSIRNAVNFDVATSQNIDHIIIVTFQKYKPNISFNLFINVNHVISVSSQSLIYNCNFPYTCTFPGTIKKFCHVSLKYLKVWAFYQSVHHQTTHTTKQPK